MQNLEVKVSHIPHQKVANALLLVMFLVFALPANASAGVLDEIKKAWNEAMSYLDLNKAAGKTAEQCSKTLDKTGQQLASEFGKLSRQLGTGDLSSGHNIGEYEKRAAEAISNLEQYKDELQHKENRTNSSKNIPLEAGGF